LICVSIIGLYVTNLSQPGFLDKSLAVSLIPLAASSVAAVISLVTYFWSPNQIITPSSVVIYLAMMTGCAFLVYDTGRLDSPFLALWALIGLASAVYGVVGWLPLLLLGSTMAGYEYLKNHLSITGLVLVIANTLMPVLVSAIIFRSKPSKDESRSNANYKNLANELSEVASKSEVVINAIGDGVIAIDNQGIIQLINPAAQSIIGWGKQDAMALNYKSVLKLVDIKDTALEPANDPIQQTLNSNQENRTNNLNVITNSGKKLMVSMVVSPVGDSGSGVIVVFRDITQEKAAEREQAEFVSTASHEMRTPVASIEGYLSLTLNPQTAQIDERARDFITKAHAAAQHLGHLFQDLLDVAKSEDGRISNNPKVVNVVALVHEIVDGLRQKAIEKNLVLTYKPIPEDSNIRVVAPSYSVNLDNDHIREIVNNLVENAIKYTPKGEIIVDVDGDDEHVVISVQDSGIGIPKEDMQHLFQKFYRVDNKDTREIGGTGLGLYLCRRLAEMMGGRIWVDSDYGQGSTFFVELPRVSSQDAVKIAEEQANAAANPPAPNPFLSQPTPQTPIPSVATTAPVQQVIEPVLNNVPRGQALTPEQIAAYVAKQRALAAEQSTAQEPQPAVSRPQSVTVPQRLVQ